MFSALLAAPRASLSRSRLAGGLWPERDEGAARHCLSTALWRIRSKLPPDQALIDVHDETISLNLAHCWIDAPVMVRRAQRITIEPALLDVANERDRLGRALALYRGSFMPERNYEWIALERERMRTLFLDAMYQLAVAELAAGRIDRARNSAQRLCEVEPFREDAQRLLMTAHDRSGSRGMALAQYRDLRELLKCELGIEPMPETVRLAERIASGRPDMFDPAPAARPVPKRRPDRDRALLLAARDLLSQSLALIDQTIDR